jgi:hypothetical protein
LVSISEFWWLTPIYLTEPKNKKIEDISFFFSNKQPETGNIKQIWLPKNPEIIQKPTFFGLWILVG